MKKTRLAKKGKQPISKIQRLLWEECRRIASLWYKPDCYTCPAKNLTGSNRQLGHVPWPKSVLGAKLKYDMRVLRFQCMRCNCHMGGMGAEAYKRMLREEGKAYMDKLEKEKQEIVKAYDFYTELLEYYKSINE